MKTQTKRTGRDGWSRAEKALVGVGGALTVFAVAGFLVWQNANAQPAVKIPPPPPLPNPNGYDFYVRAANLARTTNISQGGPKFVVQQLGRRATRAEEDAELANNAAALKTLRDGFAFPSRQKPTRSFIAPFPEYAKLRSLARLLAFEARVKSARGDHTGAVNSGLDAMRLGEDFQRGGPLIAELVGIAIGAIGRQPLWKEANFLSAAEARAAARRLEAIRALHVPYADVLAEEKWIMQAGLSDEFRKKSAAQVVRDMTGGGGTNAAGGGGGMREWLQTAGLQTRLLLTSKRRILKDNAAYMDALIARARQPYARRVPFPPTPGDPVNQAIVPVFSAASLHDLNHETANALLTTVLGLRAYQAKQGRYPARLDELVSGGILAKIPDDPCAPSGPVRYRLLPGGKKYVLYSVGADGRDDNGRPVSTLRSNGFPKRMMEENDKGDFVVGVNAF